MVGTKIFNREGTVRVLFALLVIFVCFVFPSLLYKLLSSSAHEPQRTNETDGGELRTQRAVAVERNNSVRSCHFNEPSINNFPPDLITQHQRHKGGVVIHFLLAFYMFGALTLVCDQYFIPALVKIAQKLQVRSDVVGASFMAAGSSAPELFICILGVFVAKSDVGPGTVVGSAAFNILFVLGICGLCAGSVLPLSRGPLLRDSFYYLLSIVTQVAITFDGKVYWYEAMLLVCMYVFYVILLCYNQALEGAFKHVTTCKKRSQGTNDVENDEKDDEKKKLLSKEKVGENPREDEESTFITEPQIQDQVNQCNESPFSFPQGIIQRSLWVMKLPILCLLHVTIPDCRKDRPEKWYFVAFTGALVWIGLFSYVLVWMVAIIGFTFGIPDVIMGLTFLAAGGSVSDGVSSLIVARQGDGNMAVSNVFGSNLFDILICLGLPWLFKTTAVDFGSYVNVDTCHVVRTLLLLLAMVILTLLSVMFNKWRLSKFLGTILLSYYLAFLTLSVLFEMNLL